MSLQLDFMKRALADVKAVSAQPEPVRDAYGALSHRIPILVLTNGLALTAAFIDTKAGDNSPQAKAFELIRRHMIGALDGGAAKKLCGVLDGADHAGERYMLATFTILDAWVYYKRFAVSILEVEPGTAGDTLEPQAGEE